MQLVQGQAQPGLPGKQEPAEEARPVAPAPLARLQEGAAPACIVTRVAEGQALCQQAAGACPAEYMLLGIKGVGNQRCCQQPAARAPSKDIWMSCLSPSEAVLGRSFHCSMPTCVTGAGVAAQCSGAAVTSRTGGGDGSTGSPAAEPA